MLLPKETWVVRQINIPPCCEFGSDADMMQIPLQSIICFAFHIFFLDIYSLLED